MAVAASAILRRHSRHLRRLLLLPSYAALAPLSTAPVPLPPNPFRPAASAAPSVALVPSAISAPRISLDFNDISTAFTEHLTNQDWAKVKNLFELWTRSMDPRTGQINRPDVHMFNHYLRANLMMGASAAEMLDILSGMEACEVQPDAPSFNLVLQAMFKEREHAAAKQLIDRMLLIGTLPDEDSYNLVVNLSILVNQLDSALNYLELMLKSGHKLSDKNSNDILRSCVKDRQLDTLASILEKLKDTDRSKAFCPDWKLSSALLDVALQADHSTLAFFALGYIYQWISRGDLARPPAHLSLDEGLVVGAMCTAARTYNSLLLDGAWKVLEKSLHKKRAASAEAYIAKIYAYSSLGELSQAFRTLGEFEHAHGKPTEVNSDLFSPFVSLHPLVLACTKDGFTTLDAVYALLESLSTAPRPYKSVAALNCVILGCANIWDLNRAYETFEAIRTTFGLNPDIHSYNSLLCAFGRLKKIAEASNLFSHLVSIGLEANATTYSLLAGAHLANRDPKAALAVIQKMIDAGFTPTKEMLKKVRRRCSRELDFESDERVQSLARHLKYQMGSENRKEILYSLKYSSE